MKRRKAKKEGLGGWGGWSLWLRSEVVRNMMLVGALRRVCWKFDEFHVFAWLRGVRQIIDSAIDVGN